MNREGWVLGSLFVHDRFVMDFIDNCSLYNIDTKVKAVYGNIDCKWSGWEGCTTSTSMKNFKDIIEKYNSRGIECWLNFCKEDIDEKSLDNEKCNEMVKIISDISDINRVVVRNENLEKHLKRNYPKIKIVGGFEYCVSTTFGFVGSKDGVVNKWVYIANERSCHNIDLLRKKYRIIENVCRCGGKEDKKLLNQELVKLSTIINDSCRSSRLDSLMLSREEIIDLVSKEDCLMYLSGVNSSGVTFIRDMNDFIYGNSKYFLSMARSIQGGEV